MAGWGPAGAGWPGSGGGRAGPGAGRARARLVGLVDAVSRHRRVTAGLLAAGAVGAALTVVAPAAPASRPVLAAARDLPAGIVLSGAELAVVRIPPAVAPDGALDPAAPIDGLVLAGPMRRGEVLTDARLLGPGLLDQLAGGSGQGLVAIPVRLADPGVARLLHAGQLVDVLAAAAPQLDPFAGGALPTEAGPAGYGPARVVAAAVRVIAVSAPETGDLTSATATVGSAEPLIVLATTPDAAAELANAAAGAALTVVIRARPD